MASKVGMKEAEYEGLFNAVKNGHAGCLEQISSAITKLSQLNCSEGGLYADELTPQINLMISELQTMQERIQEVYDGHETIIKTFQANIANYDSLC